MLQGALGTPAQCAQERYSPLSATVVKAIPPAPCRPGIGIALRVLFWNVGAEGQLAMGGIAAAAAKLMGDPVPPAPLVLPRVRAEK